MNIKPQTSIWTTKDKQKIRICDMTDSHLLNTIKYLERFANQYLQREVLKGYQALGTLNGDMAQMCCEQELTELEETDPQEFIESLPVYKSLKLEATRRKLLI